MSSLLMTANFAWFRSSATFTESSCGTHAGGTRVSAGGGEGGGRAQCSLWILHRDQRSKCSIKCETRRFHVASNFFMECWRFSLERIILIRVLWYNVALLDMNHSLNDNMIKYILIWSRVLTFKDLTGQLYSTGKKTCCIY